MSCRSLWLGAGVLLTFAGMEVSLLAGEVKVSSLAGNVKLIVGQKKSDNYLERIRAIHALPTNLSQEQIQAFYSFLDTKLGDQKLSDLEFNGLKNELVVKLMAQDSKPPDLAAHLVAMYHDKTFDPTWRDYCVQFFGKWYLLAPDNDGKKAMYEGLFEAVKETDGTVARAALGQLAFHAGRPGFDHAKISDLAYGVLAGPGYEDNVRLVALQVCGELRNDKALPIARAILRDPSLPVLMKMAAMAVIGRMGGKEDLSILEKFSRSFDLRLQGAATAAISRITGKKVSAMANRSKTSTHGR